MNWTHYKNFKYYYQLEQLRDVVINEYNEVKNFIDLKTSLPAESKYGSMMKPEQYKDLAWFAYPFIDDEVVVEQYAQLWPETILCLKKLSGLINATINFIGPNSLIFDHVDHQMVANLNKKIGVGTIIGIDMPSDVMEEMGFHVNYEYKTWKTGDILSFNGYKIHGGWNRTNKWRVSMIVDTDEKYWDIERPFPDINTKLFNITIDNR